MSRLHFSDGQRVNRKKVHRIMKLMGCAFAASGMPCWYGVGNGTAFSMEVSIYRMDAVIFQHREKAFRVTWWHD